MIVKFTNKGVKTIGPSRPQGVFVEASSSTTIDVKWSAPADSLFLPSFFLLWPPI